MISDRTRKAVDIVFKVLVFVILLSFLEEMRRTFPYVLCKWPSSFSRKILVISLKDPDTVVAMNSAYCLGNIGDDSVVGPLLVAVAHKDPMVRHNALNALNRLGKPDIVADAAINIVTNPREEIFVVQSAIDLLEKVRDKDNRRRAVVALQKFKEITPIENRKYDADRAIKALEN